MSPWDAVKRLLKKKKQTKNQKKTKTRLIDVVPAARCAIVLHSASDARPISAQRERDRESGEDDGLAESAATWRRPKGPCLLALAAGEWADDEQTARFLFACGPAFPAARRPEERPSAVSCLFVSRPPFRFRGAR